ncbi:MAG: PEGA domain-containing protein [Campylobacterales bacterium]|nr:PEGA domain-containing protein [Campylobacterales bacterium]
MIERILLGLSVSSVLLFTGCATIAGGGGKQAVSFSSEPAGASVSVGGAQMCTTPCQVTLDRKQDLVIKVEKEGYQSITRPLETKMNTWVLGNVIIGGLPGTTTDALNGATVEYSPNNYHFELKK